VPPGWAVTVIRLTLSAKCSGNMVDTLNLSAKIRGNNVDR